MLRIKVRFLLYFENFEEVGDGNWKEVWNDNKGFRDLMEYEDRRIVKLFF